MRIRETAHAPARDRRLLRQQDGTALIAALGIVMVLAIVTLAMIQFSSSSERSARVSAASQQAFWLAEAGLSAATALLMDSGSDPTDPTLLPGEGAPGTETYDTGTASWWGTYDATSKVWTVTAVGSVDNPTGAADTTRTVSQRYQVTGGSGGDVEAWQYVFAAEQTGCLTLSSSSQISQPLYASGDLCLQNSARVLASASPVTVLGNIVAAGSGGVGQSGAPVAILHLGGGCSTSAGGPFVFPCTSAQKVWASAQDQSPTVVTKPALDLASWYQNAAPGPNHPCTSGSFPGGFDTDTTLNRSRTPVNLFASTYDCTVWSGGTLVGRIAYDSAAKFLTIDGVVFFDGNIEMSGSQQVEYTGRGTIYASGRIALAGSQRICATSGCNFSTGAWHPDQELLVLVAGSTTDDPGLALGQSMQLQGALYAATGYTQGSSVKFQGPIVADTIDLSSSSQARYVPLTTLPPGIPSSGATSVTIIPGSWNG